MKQKKFLSLISTLILVATGVFTLALPASATPNAPTILMASGADGFIGVQVQAAGTGPVPTSYVVSSTPGSSTCTITVPNNYCNLSSLTNGTKYTVTVIAVRDGNNSPPTTTTASPREASYTLSVTDNLVDGPGECQTFTTNAPGTVLATWSGNDGVIGAVGSLSGYSLCPDWSWYGITDTAVNLTLTLWHSGTPISSGALLSTVQETYTPFASATGLYSPFSGEEEEEEEDEGDGDGGGDASSVSQVNYFVVEGFSKGKAILKKSMKKFIQKELSNSMSPIKLVCTGTVRGKKWNNQKEQLALTRARAGCDYGLSLYPGSEVELRIRLITKPKQNPLTVRIRVFK